MHKGSCCYEKLYDLQEWSQQLADSSTFLQKPYLGIKATKGKCRRQTLCALSRVHLKGSFRNEKISL